jgi:hypothetical protein
MAFLNHNIPSITCYIRNEYLFNHKEGHGHFTACDVHSVASMEKRVPLFEAFLENGVNWTRRPISAFCWKQDAPIRPLNEHMYWDCFSPYIDVQVRNRLANLRGTLIDWKGNKHSGTYMFTLDWGWENKAGMLNTNFSETPEHKCAHVFKMDEGNFFSYPNNRIIWRDDAWVYKPIDSNPGYKIDMTEYSVENTRTKVFTDNSYMTEFNDTGETLDQNN